MRALNVLNVAHAALLFFNAVPLNLYDPFGLGAKASPESKEKRLRAEINNGRLAMLGIFGFLCEQTIPGSVPGLSSIVSPYAGEVMAPFEGNLNLF